MRIKRTRLKLSICGTAFAFGFVWCGWNLQYKELLIFIGPLMLTLGLEMGK